MSLLLPLLFLPTKHRPNIKRCCPIIQRLVLPTMVFPKLINFPPRIAERRVLRPHLNTDSGGNLSLRFPPVSTKLRNCPRLYSPCNSATHGITSEFHGQSEGDYFPQFPAFFLNATMSVNGRTSMWPLFICPASRKRSRTSR